MFEMYLRYLIHHIEGHITTASLVSFHHHLFLKGERNTRFYWDYKPFLQTECN